AKPAEQTPLIAMLATRLLHEAGVPNDALHLVPGDGRIGSALTSHRDVDGVCFTGSVATAKAIAQSLSTTGRAAIPFIAETGGINAMIVDCSALPEQVVHDVLTSAFQSAGQRCSALRILCLQANIADHVISILKGALNELRVGDPSRLDTDVGPLIDTDAQQQVAAYLQSRTETTNAPLDKKIATQGTFVAPAILEVAQIADVEREVFGPVLHIFRYHARDLAKVVQEINHLGYGLTFGIHSRIRRRAQIMIDRADIGNIYVNRHMVGAVVSQQPFGGHALSGTGPKAGGPHYLLRLSQRARAANRIEHQLEFTNAALDTRIRSVLDLVRKAQTQWRQTSRHVERVQFACELVAANASHSLSAAASRVRLPDAADLSPSLANIAGEENSLRLLPRGVLLCLDFASDTLDALATQIFMAIATGNGVIAAVRADCAQELRELIAELHQMGVQDNLIACIDLPTARIPSAWLTELAIDGVVFDGSNFDRNVIATQLNTRKGALLPLLSSHDDLYRFCLEQTVTINTAAAGGDPRLLALAG
ncbi:MAG TPA: aldehyde dehydrogenase family protein, partial [Steroidobacteraceae bacterium]|nr:aldehyde dehydrogenase family protein [Steroidobacteraceae bacterium]